MSTNGLTYNYTYDAVGNIQSIFDGGSTTTYEYDELNQLVRVNDPYQNRTHTYEYENGNILFDHTYAYTEGELPVTPISSEQYFYEDSVWGDVLTGKGYISYPNSNATVASVAESAEPTVVGRRLTPAADAESDVGYEFAKRLLGENIQSVDMSAKKLSGKSKNNRKISAYSANSTSAGVLDDRINIVSDEIGNPIAIGEIQYRWNGRQLQGISIDGTEVLTYAYNTDGQRVRKEFSLPDEGLHYTYEYFYNGSILAGQKVTKVENGEETTYTLAFMYDNNGDIFGFYYNDTPYYYIKNVQNDVVMVVNTDGVAEILYFYDAWGNISNCYEMPGSNMSEINPLTYRSYYYDAELSMYYLNSRYYVPGMCRFLNADGIVNANLDDLGYNMFAYCSNDPVNNCDDNGCGKISNWFKNAVQTVKNWWNSSPPASSYTIPSTNQILSKVSDVVLGATSDFTGKYSRMYKGTITYTRYYSKSARVKLTPAGEAHKPYAKSSTTINKISAVVTCTMLAFDLGNTWTTNNRNTNGDRVIKSAIQMGGVVAGIGIGAIATAVAGPTVAGVAAFIGIVTVGGIIIDQASLYLTNKAGIE